MRKGQNPIKQLQSVARPQRITAAVLNHIPFLEGFYKQMLDVLQLSLNSLRDNAGAPLDILVFDNGSSREVIDFLVREKSEGRIQFLILSDKNLGKGGAWNVMLQAAPGEIVAYADNDVLYAQNWLSESVKVLETYPRVGMVTSRPYHTKPELFQSVIKWASTTTGVTIERGQLMDPQWNRKFLLSIGRTEEEISQDLEQEDVKLTFNGIKAYAGASHWQFLGWKRILQEFLPIDLAKPMGQVLRLDEMMDQRGYLRLMTEVPYCMNLSNSVEIPDAAKNAGNQQTKPSLWQRLVNLPLVRSPLMRIYNSIFKIYYDR